MTNTRPTWGFTKTTEAGPTFAGGIPYLLPEESWPRSEDGTAWRFLFQVELKVIPDLGLNLPEEGLLQFFTHTDDLYGMNLDGDPRENSHCLVRHVVGAVDPGDVELPREFFQEYGDSPLTEPNARVYYSGRLVHAKPLPGTIEFDETAERDTLKFEFHLGGHPAFTQEDFRKPHEDLVLLLGSESGSHIKWGDMGVGGFWLSGDALNSRKYEQAFLYWDCY